MRFAARFGLLSALFASAVTQTVNAAERPNILIILTDDRGRADYGAFGTKGIRTPNIDRLFRKGMTFDNFYANSCVCSPSRAALLIGCYPDRVGVPGVIREEEPDNSWGWLSQSVVLLPTLMKSAGCHTALVGKWHLGISSPNTPNERGFDLFDGLLGDMMDDYWTHLRHKQNFMRHNAEVVDPQGHATDVFTDWACRYLDGRAKAAEPDLNADDGIGELPKVAELANLCRPDLRTCDGRCARPSGARGAGGASAPPASREPDLRSECSEQQSEQSSTSPSRQSSTGGCRSADTGGRRRRPGGPNWGLPPRR